MNPMWVYRGKISSMEEIRGVQVLVGQIFCVVVIYYHSPPIYFYKSNVKKVSLSLFKEEREEKSFSPLKFKLQPYIHPDF